MEQRRKHTRAAAEIIIKVKYRYLHVRKIVGRTVEKIIRRDCSNPEP